MDGILGNWIMGLSGAAVFCAVMCELCPKGSVKSVVKLLCGMVMALALISPLLNMELPYYAMNLAEYRLMAEEAASDGKSESDTLSRTIIEEQCRAYILDKGQALGADIQDAGVKLRWSSEGFWYPVGCEIKGKYHGGLAAAISSELGLGDESQVWTNNEGA